MKIGIFELQLASPRCLYRWGPSDSKVTFCDANLMETQRGTTIGHFREHGLKKLEPGAKPQRSFMMVRQREIAKDIHFFSNYSPSLVSLAAITMSNIILYPPRETFVSKTPLKIFTFKSIHSWQETILDELSECPAEQMSDLWLI